MLLVGVVRQKHLSVAGGGASQFLHRYRPCALQAAGHAPCWMIWQFMELIKNV
jgi:hypothetical protein